MPIKEQGIPDQKVAILIRAILSKLEEELAELQTEGRPSHGREHQEAEEPGS